MPDNWEVIHGLDGKNFNRNDDADGDGVSNGYEYVLDLDPNQEETNDGILDDLLDTDDDGMPDLWEAQTGEWRYQSGSQIFIPLLDWLTPDATQDIDNDGVVNLDEFLNGSDPNNYDSDGDLIPDLWEINNNLSPSVDSTGLDSDSDGVEDIYEYILGLNPHNTHTNGVSDASIDTDNDGVTNFQEATTGSWVYDSSSRTYNFIANLDWNTPETTDIDEDGLSNLDEYHLHGSDMRKTDTDDDDLPDKWEVDNGYDPTDVYDRYSDRDNDNLGLYLEYKQGSSGDVKDTDGDGWDDYHEYISGSNPLLTDTDANGVNDYHEDSDDDGLTNKEELEVYLTDPHANDTDADGLLDGYEVSNSSHFNPNERDAYVDTDGDGLLTAEELLAGTDVDNPDSDGDGVEDGMEVDLGYNPLSEDSDSNGTLDGQEDFDGDGLSNLDELNSGTNIMKSDTDGDGVSDDLDNYPRDRELN